MEAVETIPYKKIQLDGTDLYIADNQVPEKIIENFYHNVLSLSFKKKEKSMAGDDYPIFSVDFDPEAFEEKTIIGGTGRRLLNTLMNAEHYKLWRVYVNMCHYGDMEWPHRDCGESETDITVLYYVNKEWKHTWGGETLFYENHDTRLAVLPTPGRFVLFYGAVEHIGSIPTRICAASRLTLAMKYKEPKQV